jgi:hypothetical protein
MMRINSGIVCVLAALALGACSWGNGSGPGNTSPDAAPVVCGDMICAASEVHSCPQDCGNGGNGSGNQQAVCGNGQCETTLGESATSCPSDCAGGGGSNTGSGGGGGALNCSDPNTIIGCGLCSAAMICTAPYDAVSCAACGGGGLGSGLGGANCNNDGMCDPGEDSATCPLDNCP